MVTYIGRIEPFPAFEMYAAVNGSAGVPLFRILPAPGRSPSDLLGSASVPVAGSVTLSCR